MAVFIGMRNGKTYGSNLIAEGQVTFGSPQIRTLRAGLGRLCAGLLTAAAAVTINPVIAKVKSVREVFPLNIDIRAELKKCEPQF
jgi:hypothetical protein